MNFLTILYIRELLHDHPHVVFATLIALVMLLSGDPFMVLGSWFISFFFFKWLLKK